MSISSHVMAQDVVTPPKKPTTTPTTTSATKTKKSHLIPAEKPDTRGFSKRSPYLINAEEGNILRPPSLPNKNSNETSHNHHATKQSANISGIPLPLRKPSRASRVASKSFHESVIQPYSGNDVSDRTAGYKQDDEDQYNRDVERLPAQPQIRIHETDEDSPFQTAKLPRAGTASQQDPVIIFFKENSSDLEVGQLSVVENDVLRYLKRNSRGTVTIYGFAEGNKGKDRANQLSLNRATIIGHYLHDNKITEDRIHIRGMGTDTPISPKNRVDIVLD